ncbi:hypothetical protein BV898_10037 [Hypsibius exemplaris]|uniref:Uncharacterized protein n=1 Tax=Hypsibius exemplaris TaxID=2072580 RepID=A0A1W0WKQ3_HYPEX|nr:hypothetical protein BV898_10037 [Hypsibius exemplaris]
MLLYVPHGTPENPIIIDNDSIPIPPPMPTLAPHSPASPPASNQAPLEDDQMDDSNNEDDEDDEDEEDNDSMRSEEELEVAAIHSHRIWMAEYEFLMEFTNGKEPVLGGTQQFFRPSRDGGLTPEWIASLNLAGYEEDIMEYLQHHPDISLYVRRIAGMRYIRRGWSFLVDFRMLQCPMWIGEENIPHLATHFQ